MRIGCRALVTGEYVLDKKAIREAMRLGSHEELPPTINALNITLTLAHDSRTFEIEIRRASRGGQKTKTQRAVGTWTASGIVLELRSSGREPLSFSCEVSAVAVLRCKNNTSSDGLVLVFKRSSQP